MPRNRSVAVALFVALAALSTLLIAAPASAEDLESELEAKQSKLEEVGERKGVLTTTISRYGDEIDQLTGEVAAIRTREAAVRVRLEAKQAELNAAVAELDVAHDRLDGTAGAAQACPRRPARATGGDVRNRQPRRAQRHRRLRRRRRPRRSGRIPRPSARHGRGDRRPGARPPRRGAGTGHRLRSAKKRIEAARDAIASEQQALIDARAALQSRQQQLVDARHRRESALAQISTHEEELHGDVAAIQGEIAAQLATSGSAPLPAGPIIGGSGGLIWPVNGAVVSGFGPRWGSMHEGVDIAVPEMTPIRAAASGSVVLLQSDAESGGYGNFTCIDHGGGLSTCYAHQTSFAVSAGQSVSQGDDHRVHGLHGALPRTSPAFRGSYKRLPDGPDGLPLAIR